MGHPSAYSGFDTDRDIRSMRGQFFPTSPSDMGDMGGLTPMQADFLQNEFVTRIVPIQKELSAIDDRRTERAYNDLRLQEQAFRFDEAREESRLNRELLTRMPEAMADLDAITAYADTDPELAARALLGVQRNNADLYAKNPAFRTVFEATNSRVGEREAKRKADYETNLSQAATLLAQEDPELVKMGRANLGALDPREQKVVTMAEAMQAAAARAKTKGAEATAAKGWMDDQDAYYDRLLTRLDSVKSVKPSDMPRLMPGDPGFDAGAAAAVPAATLATEDRVMLDGFVTQLGVENPDTDPFRLREQLYATILQKKQALRQFTGGKPTSEIPQTMRQAAGK